MKGVLDHTYALQREKRLDIRYRLIRRTHEILQAIAKYHPNPKSILDLGTAEGRMLSAVKLKYFNNSSGDPEVPNLSFIETLNTGMG